MKNKKAALHIHSYYSDGFFAPSVIVGYAKIAGIGVLSITDHNEIKGTISAMRIAEKIGLIYFPGIELTFSVSGRPYELLAYFYNIKNIKKFYDSYRFNNGFIPSYNSVDEVFNLVKRHKGIVIVPHPFGRKGIYRKGRNRHIKPEGIEVLNAFTGEKRNLKALSHNDCSQCIKIGAADMHFFINDISKTYTEIVGKKITKREIWENLSRNKKTLKFNPIGKKFPTYKISIQKPLCILSYGISYPRLYFLYLRNKINE